jgi:2-polyprenyl-3-methyl-5-hydroxy-6-metoxy-1,4-benzoquinol methylase
VASASGIDVHLGTLESTDLGPAAFDAITLCHVIEHLPDPGSALRRCYALVKPGGRLVVITPSVASLGHLLFGHAWRGLEPPRHFVLFHPRALACIVSSAGFTDLCLRTSARSSISWFQASNAIQAMNGQRCLSPFGAKLASRLFCALEHAANAASGSVGEEIVLIATRS